MATDARRPVDSISFPYKPAGRIPIGASTITTKTPSQRSIIRNVAAAVSHAIDSAPRVWLSIITEAHATYEPTTTDRLVRKTRRAYSQNFFLPFAVPEGLLFLVSSGFFRAASTFPSKSELFL